ncbi:MAG TPA: amidohydrolase family protein [Burkholderiales bacterium]|nr:amidohydrolase family protein [Burkholderiales bacterium]
MSDMQTIPIVDAHHHLWDLDQGPLHYPWLQDPEPHAFFLGDSRALRRSYLPEDYRRDAAHHRVVKTVHVEAECARSQQVEETRWLTEINARHGMPDAIVAHAWFHTPEAEAILARHAEYPLVRGIRSKPVTANAPGDARPDGPGSMQDLNWIAGYRLLAKFGFSWDLRVPAWHLAEAAAVVRANPDIPVVLNHSGFPWDRSAEGLELWRRGMRALADSAHCYCKLSCLCLRAGAWDYADNRRIVLETIELFGVERCMFASNFPVDGLRVSFAQMFDDFKRMTADFTAAERLLLFHDNAARFYRL